jgi:ATP-dependent HslUV protease ATP-binding subunit HslU
MNQTLPDTEPSGVPLDDLTPREIVEALDKYIIGQEAAKRAVAVAIRNRYRRQMLPDDLRDEVIPKNIIMIGPTGVGKTEIARRLAALVRAPFIKVEATKYTEVGYVGRDVDSMIRDLTDIAVRMVEQERLEEVQEEAERRAEERLLELLVEPTARERPSAPSSLFGPLMGATEEPEETPARRELREREERQRQTAREITRRRLQAGELEDMEIEIEVDESQVQSIQMFSPMGMEEMGIDMQQIFSNLFPKRKTKRRLTVEEARRQLAWQEAQELVDQNEAAREAVERVEEMGIVFLDELDKIAGRESGHGPDVSREGVQRDVLPIIEGSTVPTKYGPVNTQHILFIAAGAFHVSKPSDLIPELQGRFPLRVELDSLTEDDFRRILIEPRNSLVRQYTGLLATEKVELVFREEGLAEIARIAARVNEQSENIGARRLYTVMERLLEDISFHAPDVAPTLVDVTAAYVRDRLEKLMKDEDLSRYVL